MIEQAERGVKLKELEEKIQKWWEDDRIYEKCKSHRKGGQKYYFLDGPPYASGSIHLGTAWNKILKDAVVRYLSMKGLNVRRQAGWDCHGLPIELKVEEKLGIKNKHEIEELGEREFIKECEKWAHEHIEIMTEQFSRLGVWMDWDRPYMTLKNEYIEAAWWTIKKANEKGLLTNDLGVVTWCPRCETALANVEIEFSERVDPSIYVKFPVVGKEGEYLLIWTTTPWTLIGNLAVMVHPEFEYAKVRTKEGDLILANALVDVLENDLNLEYEVIDVMQGKDLEGLRYKNPLEEVIDVSPSKNAYSVILTDFVSLEEGTGCVHSAPGHGPEDFEACAPYNIEPICPVDEGGAFTKEAGKFAGLTVKKDDKAVLKELEERGALLLSTQISHRYGHCWRCKSPIIYRATKQWFIKVTTLIDRMLEETEKVEWVPDWAGSSRFKDWIENIKDWTISRQRYWGIPLPIWVCKECGNIEAIGSRKELEKKGFKIKDMHKPFVDKIVLKCECGGEELRVPDVLDVWFDSGVAAWASLGYPGEEAEFKDWYPVDFITEGHDQTRGWFYSQLGCGLIAFDMIPYKRVLQHGFTLDEKGNKMSKSLGNVVQPEEVIERFGTEVLRFYILWANKPWDDLRFNWTEVEVIDRMFNIFWNAYVFATTYMALDKFDPTSLGPDVTKYYTQEDKWIMSRLNTVVKEVTEAFESLQLYSAPRIIHNFILEDLSRWYIPFIRFRTWMESEDLEKLTAYHVLYEIFTTLATILAPISPHLSEEMHRNLTANFGGEESVHMKNWITPNKEMIDEQLEED
ncbi:MAG: isoleucine--tRNA ligase, partial [Candidatus Hydrothermarchaeales archaeon]